MRFLCRKTDIKIAWINPWLRKLFVLEMIKFNFLDIQISWPQQMPKHETWNTFYWITWKVNSVWWWNLTSFCYIRKEKPLSKIFTKNVVWKLIQALFDFPRIFCKKESEEVGMLILTNFDSFAITYLIWAGCFKSFIFQ